MQRRSVEILVLSDLHLGTQCCRAQELVHYLKSVQPQILVLNGDIIDCWQSSKHYFPPVHMQVIREIFSLLSEGTQVIYITGNHDAVLRRYTNRTFNMGKFSLADKVMLETNGKKTWIFHGDVFDVATKNSAKFLSEFGGSGYKTMMLLNRFVNSSLRLSGKEKISLSKKIKSNDKHANKLISNFEQTVAELAIRKKYDYVICGHTHSPVQKVIEYNSEKVTYMNCGDWIDNLTALEFDKNEWKIYQYNESAFSASIENTVEYKLPELNIIPDEVSMFISSLISPSRKKSRKIS